VSLLLLDSFRNIFWLKTHNSNEGIKLNKVHKIYIIFNELFLLCRFEIYTTSTGELRYATVGFATVYRYYAYPQHIRPRIAQFLILPPFQNLGIGAHLLQTIYREYIARKDVTDITGNKTAVDKRILCVFYANYIETISK